jgi:hypothetical protein
MSRRAEDLKLLEKALTKLREGDDDEMPDYLLDARAAFAEMFSRIRGKFQSEPTVKQRAWVADIADEVVYENLHSSGKVHDGLGLSRVVTPEVLRNLPKKPPQRKP